MKRWIQLTIAFAALVLVACGTEPGKDPPDGVWALVSVAGKPLPAKSGNSTRTIHRSHLTLSASTREADYGAWTQSMSVMLADGTGRTENRTGTWVRTGASLHFTKNSVFTKELVQFTGTWKANVIVTGSLRWERRD